MFTEIERARLAVGQKQTKKAILSGASRIFIAEDTPYQIAEEIKTLAGNRVEVVESMKRLGAMCGIDVKASCAAIKR